MATGFDAPKSTEWEDVQRRFGNLPPREVEVTKEDIERAVIDAAERQKEKDFERKTSTLEKLGELEDELDDDVLQRLREKRIAEMKARAAKERFGELVHISEPDFVREVTEASAEAPVVVFLYKRGIPACELVEKHLASLARRFRATKFVRMVSTDCIRNFPDGNLPAALVYRGGAVQAQMIGSAAFGGAACGEADVEWRLGRAKAVETELEEDPRGRARITVQRSGGGRRGGSDDESDEERRPAQGRSVRRAAADSDSDD